MKEASEKTFKVTNESVKPVTIWFTKSTNYRITPDKFTLGVKEGKELSVVFKPKVIGEANEIITLNLGQF